MDRLTHERVNGIKTGYWSPNKKDELIERLAAYENTGLTPEKITTMIQDRETAIGSLPNGTWWVKDNDGKSIPWREIPDSLYGALCKLHDYEKTGLTPSDVERLLDEK